MRRLIALRRRHRVLGRGTLRVLLPENSHTLAFVREDDSEHILVVANLSRSGQAVQLDLAPWVGRTPVELFGGVDFPPIGASPYLFTLGPYGFHILRLDLRQNFHGKPYDLQFKETSSATGIPGSKAGGIVAQWEASVGFSIAFGGGR